VSIVSASGCQKPQFWATFDIFGGPVPTLFYRWDPNLVCYSRPTVYAYVQHFVLIGLFWRPLAAKNTNFCRFFWNRHLVASPVGSSLRKFNTGAQLYKPSLIQCYQNRFWTPTTSWRNRAHNLWRSNAWRTNRQTDRQTDRQKTQRCWPPQRRVKSEPHQTWYDDRGHRARSCTSKLLGVWRIVSLLGGALNLGVTRPPQLNPHNSSLE